MQIVTTVMVQSSSLGREYITHEAHALIDIMDTYEKQKDPLSIHLYDWGCHFVQEVMSTGLSSSAERLHSLVHIHFIRLEQEVLRDQLLSAGPNTPVVSLDEPVVERGFVWGKKAHQRCYVLFQGISPIDRRPMDAEPPSHAFAQAVINWKSALTVALEGTPYSMPLSESTVVVIRMPSTGDQNVEREGFRCLASYLKVQQLRAGRLRLVRHTQHTLSIAAANQEENRALVVHAQEQADAHEARLAEMLERLKEEHQMHLQQLEDQFEEQDRRYRADIQQMEQNLAAAEASNEATAAFLRKRLTEIQEEQQRTHAAFEAQVQAANALQEQKVRELKAKQTLIETQHQTQLTQMESTHRQAVDTLQGRVEDLSEKFTATQNALTNVQHTSERQERHIQALNRQTDILRRAVDRERRRAEEAEDDWSCSLM